MAEQKPNRRILVGLDASRLSSEVQKAAAKIASFLKAELDGLFVEDINLIHLAQLPFTEEIRALTSQPAPLDAEDIQKRLKTQATLLRYELEQIAADSNLEWTFNVVRGLVTQELLRAAQGADLLILGRFSRQRSYQKRIGSTALTAVRQAAGPVLILTPEIDFFRPVLLLYDGSAAADRALQLSLALAQASRQIQIILKTSSEVEAGRCKNNIADSLSGTPVFVTYQPPILGNGRELLEIIHDIRPGIIVTSQGGEDGWPEAVEQLLHTTDYPLLIVQSG